MNPQSADQTALPLCEWIFHVLEDSNVSLTVFLSQNIEFELDDKGITCFHANETEYFGFCDDFGPLNFASVASFIQILDGHIAACTSPALVYCARDGRRALTNAAFLLGAFMVLRLNMAPPDVSKRFETFCKGKIEDYRDATFWPPDFGLKLIDCWAGLHRAKERSWLARPTLQAPQRWGKLDIEEYLHYENPLNGDLHEVVPGKLVAFQGPKDLRGRLHYDDDGLGQRSFSPAYYLGIFRELGVSTVVRLNEAHYSARAFTDAGLEHHDLYFDDCTAPPRPVVERFLRILDSAPGAVAVHCKAGLGRTGTLIALYLMRSCGFGAREAMGWLRVMRPGSVIGEQQHYLCEVERQLDLLARRTATASQPPGRASHASADPLPPAPSAPRSPARDSPPPRGDGGSARPAPAHLAAQVAAGMARRGAARGAGWASRRQAGAC